MLVWTGGALFVAALAVTGWWYGVILGRALPGGGGFALAVDATLITVFALHHSLFAREPIKRSIARWVPPHLAAFDVRVGGEPAAARRLLVVAADRR